MVQISYKGTGLSPLEVAEMYVRAADEGDFKTVKSLQLESFYPDIIKDLEEFSLNNPSVYPGPVLEHDFIDNSDIFLKNNTSTPYVGEDFLVVSPEGYYGEYHYIGFYMSISYCSYNACMEENTEIEHDYYFVREEIYLIEVNGNYYILGEKQAPPMAVEEAVKRKALFMADGDTTNLSFKKTMDDFDNCNQDDECLNGLGYTDLY